MSKFTTIVKKTEDLDKLVEGAKLIDGQSGLLKTQ
jgi:hypothetical protein